MSPQQPGEVLFDELKRKCVVAGRHGRVGREDRAAAHFVERAVERRSALDELTDSLQGDEGGVPFVQVPHRRLDAERAQHTHAADAEDDLLLDSRLAIAAVQAGRQLPIPRRVLLEVGVEQEQPDAADANAPHRRQHRAIAERHGGERWLAVPRNRRVDWRVGPFESFVVLLLPAFVRNALVEVALRVHEPDADQRHAEVAGLLAVIAGEHAQAAGIDGQRLVQRELRREVRDDLAVERRTVFAPTTSPWPPAPGRGPRRRHHRAPGTRDPARQPAAALRRCSRAFGPGCAPIAATRDSRGGEKPDVRPESNSTTRRGTVREDDEYGWEAERPVRNVPLVN